MANEVITAIEAKMAAPKPDLNAAHEQTRAEAVATHSEDVVNSVSTAPETTPAETDTGETVASDGTDTPARQNKGVGKRINELTKEKHDERRRREAVERELSELRATLSTPAQTQTPAQQDTQAPASGKPTLESCDFDPEVLAERMADWKLDQRDRQAAENKQKETHQQRLRSYQERADAFADENPDYAERVESLKLTPIMDQAIFETELEPQIAYYLATNPGEVERIAQLTPAGQVRAIAKLEDKLSAPPVVEQQEAETPRPAVVPSRPPSVQSPPPPPPSVAAKSTAKAPVAQWDINQHIEAVRSKATRR
jgi:hypothetical protein